MKLITGVRSILFGLIAFLLVACSGSDGNNNLPPAAPTSSGEITGQILDGTTGQALSGAMVSADEQSTTTATDGSYTLLNVGLGDRVVVTVSIPGFADQSKIVRISSQAPNANLPVGILPVGLEQEFDPDTAQTLTVVGSPASVILAATSLTQADGSAPDGNVTVNLTVIDPTVDIELMPGDMQTDVGGGTLSPIESFGAMDQSLLFVFLLPTRRVIRRQQSLCTSTTIPAAYGWKKAALRCLLTLRVVITKVRSVTFRSGMPTFSTPKCESTVA